MQKIVQSIQTKILQQCFPWTVSTFIDPSLMQWRFVLFSEIHFLTFVFFWSYWHNGVFRIQKKHMQEEEVRRVLRIIYVLIKHRFHEVLTFDSINLAPWTFNPSLFLKCLQTLRKEVWPISLSNNMSCEAVNVFGLILETCWFIGVSLCSIIRSWCWWPSWEWHICKAAVRYFAEYSYMFLSSLNWDVKPAPKLFPFSKLTMLKYCPYSTFWSNSILAYPFCLITVTRS